MPKIIIEVPDKCSDCKHRKSNICLLFEKTIGGGYNSNLYVRCPDCIAAEVKEEIENKILRKLLWLRHGCEGLYGDDGEMQCGKCRIDFKRDDIDKIYGIFEKAALNKLLNNGKLIKKGE